MGADSYAKLRGRYWIALSIGFVLAVIFAVVGIFLGKAQYASLAQIRIKPNVTVVMYQGADPEKGMLPMFESYVETQAALFESSRVLNMAMTDDLWKRTGYGTGPDAIDLIQKRLVVLHIPNSFLIDLQFLDPKPEVTQPALQSIINAYKKLYAQADADNSERRREVLEAHLEEVKQNVCLEKAGRFGVGAQTVGTTDLDKRYEFEADQLDNYEATLKDLELQSAMASATTTRPTASATGLDAEDIAAQDRPMQDLLTQRQAALLQTLSSLQNQGLMDNHPQVKDVRGKLAMVDASIHQRVTEFNQKLASGQMALATNNNGASVNSAVRLYPCPTQSTDRQSPIRFMINPNKNY